VEFEGKEDTPVDHAISAFRTRWGLRGVAVPALVGLVMLLLGSVARADVVFDNLDTTVDAAAESLNLTISSAPVTLTYTTTDPSDPVGGCNLTGLGSQLVVSVASSNTATATLDKSQLTFVNCTTSTSVTVTPHSPGTAIISLSFVSVTTQKDGVTSSNFDLAPATFTVTVTSADTTAPVITPNVAGTLGANGWYTSNVTLTWTVNDPESTVTSSTGCGTSTVSSDTTGQTFTCTATSSGGTNLQSVTIMRDATAPTGVAGAFARGADANGWYNAPVDVTFSGTDATSGVASCTSATYSGPDGTGLTVSGTCADNAGNVSPSVASPTFE
jgi:hypothetical protein